MSEFKKQTILQKMILQGDSLSAAMRKAGYSKTYAKNPQKFKATKAWRTIADDRT